jgi:hypothetical protein
LALVLTFLGWDSLYVPEDLMRFLQISLIVAAISCAHPLRKVLSRARPLGWGEKLVVFSLVLALWFSALVPLLMIINVKLDSSSPIKIERDVLETEDRGQGTCKVRVTDWRNNGDPEPHWFWLACKAEAKKVSYVLGKGALQFEWVKDLKLLP